jgi:ribosomal-protein-alanine N-acetyltransferase
MHIVFQSRRLLFREFTTCDASLIYDLNKDDKIRKYVHEAIPTLESSEKSLREIILPQYKLYKHGRWALHLKSTQEFIGWCGLKHIAEANEIDLGYRLMKNFWGNGYASEAAETCIRYGFEQLNIQKIIARAHVDNIASIKVIEKCGMKLLQEETWMGDPVKTFAIEKG